MEIRLRAERKAGQLIAEMEKAKGGRPPKNRSHDATDYRGAEPLASCEHFSRAARRSRH